jgi:subtilisin family serine protease
MPKLDARLRNLARPGVAFSAQSDLLGVEAPRVAGVSSRVEVLVRCSGAKVLPELVKAGMTVRAASAGARLVASGDVSLADLETLAQINGVERVESSRVMVKELDISSVETGAVLLHQNQFPVRGQGSLVGIIDTGIDYTHPDFRNAEGSSRILALWDQGAPAPVHGGVPYGRSYTKAELDFALQSSIPLHGDIGAHGTHVAGIASGNGAGSLGWFTGIAPESGLIVVATRPDPDGKTLGRSAGVFEAFTYIVAWARFFGLPVAINLSQGMNGGGHCGETVLETGLNDLARQAGVVIVKSAGNEQEWRIHAGGQLTQGQTVEVGLLVPSNDVHNDVLEVWHDGNVRVQGNALQWETNVPVTSAVRFHTQRRLLELRKKVESQSDLVLRTTHEMTLQGLAPGTYFCEILAFTAENLLTTDDNAGSFYLVQIA